jgi:signal transduction histidine kinase
VVARIVGWLSSLVILGAVDAGGQTRAQGSLQRLHQTGLQDPGTVRFAAGQLTTNDQVIGIDTGPGSSPRSFFTQQRRYVIAGLIVFGTQSVLIAGLLIERALRRKAEKAGRHAVRLNRDLAFRFIASQEAERARIARDLHDDVCQDVASVGVDLSHLRQKRGDIQDLEVQELLLSLQRRAAAMAESLRLLSHGLHPSVLDHVGLVAALQAHCAEVERHHGLEVRFSGDDVEPASRLVALSLFRIAQEALRNIVKHGQARRACVSLTRDASSLTLSVSDDGRGFDPSVARDTGGLGLVSIEERARIAGGEVTFRSQPGHGATVEVRVPWRSEKTSLQEDQSLPATSIAGHRLRERGRITR